jgi:hypothetical protein
MDELLSKWRNALKKFLITGTGRSGTTFLMLILSYLNLDTGFENEKELEEGIFPECNAGLEQYSSCVFGKEGKKSPRIVKSPSIIHEIDSILKRGIQIEHVFIPVRDYYQSANSRSKNISNGGFWKAKNVEDQISFYHKIMAEFLVEMVKNDIDTTFLDFEKMITSEEYTFKKLNPVLEEISFSDFSEAFKKASRRY